MKEDLNDDTEAAEPQEGSEVIVLIKQIQQQMVYLEKKLDLLLAQSPQKSFSRENSFSRPRRPFGDSSFRHGKGRHEHRPGGGNFSHERPSFHRSREHGSSEGRKEFSREGGFDRGHRFDKPQDGGNYKPFQPKGRFFDKKRERKGPYKSH